LDHAENWPGDWIKVELLGAVRGWILVANCQRASQQQQKQEQ
jgi:hypothetical protein